MLPQKFLKDYFSFTRKDRTGVLILFFLIVIIYFLPLLYPRKGSFPLETRSPEVAAAVDSMLSGNAGATLPERRPASGYAPAKPKDFVPAGRFRFDPNTLSPEGWKKLGLADRPIRTIIHYRSKGGRFHYPADLQKIWGLPPGFYEWVRDSIDLPAGRGPEPAHPAWPALERKEKKTGPVAINEADSAAWVALPGIGPRLASRILAFRDRLGGFHSIDQVRETYGLSDSTFQLIRSYLQAGGTVKKLNMNTASKEELKAHPYIRWQLANAIVAYRDQHKGFKSVDELRNLALMTDTLFTRLKPYLTE